MAGTVVRSRVTPKGTRPTVQRKARPADNRPGNLEFKNFDVHLLSKAEDLEATPGVVEAIVAVTGNTDDGGDVIQPGAFHFKRAPKVVWSHNLRELVGKVLVYEEWKPGDVRLPADLRAKGYGGLYFKMMFDLEDPESFKAYRKVVFHEDLGWSIGYETDPKGFKMLPDGRRSLTKVYVWEGSPTTFGMNQEARTVSVKSLIQTTVDDLGLTEEKATALQAALVALMEAASPETEEEKAYVPLAGSMEETQNRLRAAVEEWATVAVGERDDETDWYVSVEGTFEDSVVATIRVWKGEAEGGTYRFPYTEDQDGNVLLGEAEEVEVVGEVVPASGTTTVTEEVTTTEGTMSFEDAETVVSESMAEVKAGRVLSAANAARLRQAQETITAVLAAAEKGEDDDEKKKGEKATAPVVVPKAAVVGAPEGEGEVLDEKAALELLILANT